LRTAIDSKPDSADAAEANKKLKVSALAVWHFFGGQEMNKRQHYAKEFLYHHLAEPPPQ
jgi:hypothetical protein